MGWKGGNSSGHFPSLEKVHLFIYYLSIVRKTRFQMHGSGWIEAGAGPTGCVIARTGLCYGWLVTGTQVPALHALLCSHVTREENRLFT